MSSDSPLHQRAQTLQDLFFARQSAERIEAMRAGFRREQAIEALSAELHWADKAVLADLVDHGVSHETLLAFSLIPMLHVAYADGGIGSKEREAILGECLTAGGRSDSAGWALLESWLSDGTLTPALLDTWKELYPLLVAPLDAARRAAFDEHIVASMNRVARAAGGLLGIGASSAEERVAIDEIAAFMAGVR